MGLLSLWPLFQKITSQVSRGSTRREPRGVEVTVLEDAVDLLRIGTVGVRELRHQPQERHLGVRVPTVGPRQEVRPGQGPGRFSSTR